jgi:hypothetical protein
MSTTRQQAKALIEPILAAGDDTVRVEAGGPGRWTVRRRLPLEGRASASSPRL